MNLELLKCHGSGNDFILIDESSNRYNLDDKKRVDLTKVLSDRKGIIGCDGVIFFDKSQGADAKSRIFNADGSEAELCGNGIRCVARYASELFNKENLIIETIKSRYSVHKEPNIYDNIPTFSVDIDTVTQKAGEVPIIVDSETLFNSPIKGFFEQYKFSAVSLTNPHLITFVQSINSEDLEKVGKAANTNKTIFPRGINVSFCKVLSDNTIEVETYERGVGLTYSCGTAMSASSLIYCQLYDKDNASKIKILNRGGFVYCKVNKIQNQYTLTLIGNATYVYKTNIDIDFDKPIIQNKIDGTSLHTSVGKRILCNPLMRISKSFKENPSF